MEASRRQRRGWDDLMAKEGHKAVNRNARKRTRASGRRKVFTSRTGGVDRGNALVAALTQAHTLEASNLRAGDGDEGGDDDWVESDEEGASGGKEAAKRRRGRKGSTLVKRVFKLQRETLGSIPQDPTTPLARVASALGAAVPDVSLALTPTLSGRAASRLPVSALLTGQEGGGGHREVGAAVVEHPSGLFRLPGPGDAPPPLWGAAAPAAVVIRAGPCAVCGGPGWGEGCCPRTGVRLCSAKCAKSAAESRVGKGR